MPNLVIHHIGKLIASDKVILVTVLKLKNLFMLSNDNMNILYGKMQKSCLVFISSAVLYVSRVNKYWNKEKMIVSCGRVFVGRKCHSSAFFYKIHEGVFQRIFSREVMYEGFIRQNYWKQASWKVSSS